MKLSARIYISFGIILSSLFLTMSFCSANDLSGTYITITSDGAFMVEIVQTKDGRITGKASTVTIDENSKVEVLDTPLSGTAAGKNVKLEIRPVSFLPAYATITGSLNGTRLELDAKTLLSKSEKLDLVLAQASEFDLVVQKLKARAASEILRRQEISKMLNHGRINLN